MPTSLLILACQKVEKVRRHPERLSFLFLDNLVKNLAPAEIWHHVAEALVFVRCLPEVGAYLCPHDRFLHTLCLGTLWSILAPGSEAFLSCAPHLVFLRFVIRSLSLSFFF